MVANALNSLYDSEAYYIITNAPVMDEETGIIEDNDSNSQSEVFKCRLVTKNYPYINKADLPLMQTYSYLLFPTNIEIPPGSRLFVTNCGETIEFKSTGTISRYSNHNQVNLERAEQYA